MGDFLTSQLGSTDTADQHSGSGQLQNTNQGASANTGTATPARSRKCRWTYWRVVAVVTVAVVVLFEAIVTLGFFARNISAVEKSADEYMVNFHYNGTLLEQQIVTSGSVAVAPQVPNNGTITHAGKKYNFSGWSLDGETVVVLKNMPITADTDLYAIFKILNWEEATFTQPFYGCGRPWTDGKNKFYDWSSCLTETDDGWLEWRRIDQTGTIGIDTWSPTSYTWSHDGRLFYAMYHYQLELFTDDDGNILSSKNVTWYDTDGNKIQIESGASVWHDQDGNCYYSNSSNEHQFRLVTDATGQWVWEPVTWNIPIYAGNRIWIDDTGCYYANNSKVGYRLTDADNGLWSEINWVDDQGNALTIDAPYVWTDEYGTFFSYQYNSYHNNISTIGYQLTDPDHGVWTKINWRDQNGDSIAIGGHLVWSAFGHTVFSHYTDQYELVRDDNSELVWQAVSMSMPFLSRANVVWHTQGRSFYSYASPYSSSSDNNQQFELGQDEQGNLVWSPKQWNIVIYDGNYVWEDPNGIYYSYGVYYNTASNTGYRLVDLEAGTWEKVDWVDATTNEALTLDCVNVWVDENSYCSSGSTGYQLMSVADGVGQWHPINWVSEADGNPVNINGRYVWQDNYGTYYVENNTTAYQLINIDRREDTWVGIWRPVACQTTKGNSLRLSGAYVWAQANDYYYSNGNGNAHYHLVEHRDDALIWDPVTWNVNKLEGVLVWSDGDEVYYTNSYGATLYLVGAYHLKVEQYVNMVRINVTPTETVAYQGATPQALFQGAIVSVEHDDVYYYASTSATMPDSNVVGTNNLADVTGAEVGTYYLYYRVEAAATEQQTFAFNATDSNPWVFSGVTATITPKEITYDPGAMVIEHIYDGTRPMVNVDTSAFTLRGLVAGDDVQLQLTVQFNDRNVGTNQDLTIVSVGLSGTARGNYVLAADGHGRLSGTITPRVLKVIRGLEVDPVTINSSVPSFSWDQTSALSGVVAGDDVYVANVEGEFIERTPSQWTVQLTDITLGGDDRTNYQLNVEQCTPQQLVASVMAIPVTVEGLAPAVNTMVYNGQSQVAVNTSAMVLRTNDTTLSYPADQLTVSSDRLVGQLSAATVGTHAVMVDGLSLTGSVSQYYTLSATQLIIGEVTVTPRPLYVTGLQVTAATVDSTVPEFNWLTAHLEGVLEGDDVQITQVSGHFVDRNTTPWEVAVDEIKLIGTAAGNYQIDLADLNEQFDWYAQITPLPVRVSGIVPAVTTMVYNGNCQVPLDLSEAQFIKADGTVLDLPASQLALDENVVRGELVNAHVGEQKVRVNNLTLVGSDSIFYTIDTTNLPLFAATTVTITPRPVTISGWPNLTKTYDGTTAITVFDSDLVVHNVVPTDQVTLQVAAADFVDATVGSNKAVTLTATLCVDGMPTQDYQTELPQLVGTIEPQEITYDGIVVTPKVYDGTTAVNLDTSAMVLTGALSTDEVSLSIGAAAYQSAQAGTQNVRLSEVSLTGAAASNYVLADLGQQEVTGVIKRRPLTVTVGAHNSMVGEPLVTLVGEITSGSLIDGDQAADVYQLQTNATPEVAGQYEIVGVVQDVNYDVTFDITDGYTVSASHGGTTDNDPPVEQPADETDNESVRRDLVPWSLAAIGGGTALSLLGLVSGVFLKKILYNKNGRRVVV